MPKELEHIEEDPQVNVLLGYVQEKINFWWELVGIYPIPQERKEKIVKRVGELLADGNF